MESKESKLLVVKENNEGSCASAKLTVKQALTA